MMSYSHYPHVKNFLSAIEGREKLNCSGEQAFASEAAVYKINEAIEAEKKIYFKDSDFVV